MVRNFYKKYLIIVGVVGGIIILNNFLLGNFFRNTFYKIIFNPAVFISKKLPGVANFSSRFLKTQRLVDENLQIREENNILLGELSQLENLKRENKFLRDELGVSRKINEELLLARIFNIRRDALTATAVINKGQKDGIRKSFLVIATGNIVVGLIDQVFENYSSVLLLDDPRTKISGRIQNSNVLVNVFGKLHNELSLGLVTAGDKIEDGSTIVTSGLDGLPEAMPIAKVIKIETQAGALFKAVTASPLFDQSLGSNLFVVITR
ncbi:MAG: rod shape-determining protein MreC [Patescibacteria group bacterium]